MNRIPSATRGIHAFKFFVWLAVDLQALEVGVGERLANLLAHHIDVVPHPTLHLGWIWTTTSELPSSVT